ncbi:MAG: Ig-like domain-containing protein [Gammaproteobacteria bacterium]|nr:Ig-like domain-containing protein [Gammaproteobacteria bacterium]
MKYSRLIISLVAVLFIGACSDSSDFDFEKARQEAEEAAAQTPGATFEAKFDPGNQIIPFPNNLLLLGSEDGTINISVDDETNYADPQVALNALDGFSTTAPISTTFSQAIDPASVILGDTVRVFEVSASAEGAVTGVVGELNQTQIAATVTGETGNTLVLLPLQPLKESSTYMVVLTNGIKNTADPASIADKSVSYYLISGDTPLTTGAAQALEPLRQLTATYHAAANANGVPANNIVLSWTFTTQSISPILQAVYDASDAGTIAVSPTGVPSSELNPALQGASLIHFGSLTVPYYQTAPTDDNPQQAVNGFWKAANGGFLTRFNPQPVATSEQTIPLLLSTPAGDAPGAGWPVVIFQHGITQDRSNMLALADGMAAAGLAVIAIDLPMHGVAPDSPLNAANEQFAPFGATERTFGLDLINNDSRAAGGDGVTDPSGTHFYNLSNLLNARDNLRQAASDLMTLRKSIGNVDAVPLDADTVGFIGHSLGGITGTTFLAFDDQVGPASLAMPGVGLARLLAGSASFGPIINAGLADQGAPEGSVEYESFLTVAQTVIDSGDPVNFSTTAAGKHPVHLMEVVGGSGGSLSDQVIPNAINTAPLSGTEPMIRLMGLDPVISTTGNGSAPVSGAVRFISGDHGSILNPAADALVTVEMQTQVAKFMASRGTLIEVNDTSVIDIGE